MTRRIRVCEGKRRSVVGSHAAQFRELCAKVEVHISHASIEITSTRVVVLRSCVTLFWVHAANIGAERTILCAKIREFSASIIKIDFADFKEVGASEVLRRESVDVVANGSEVRVATDTHVRIGDAEGVWSPCAFRLNCTIDIRGRHAAGVWAVFILSSSCWVNVRLARICATLIFGHTTCVSDVSACRVITSFIDSAICIYGLLASWSYWAVLFNSSVLESLCGTASAHAVCRVDCSTIRQVVFIGVAVLDAFIKFIDEGLISSAPSFILAIR